MSQNMNVQGGSCCGPRIPGLRILTFPDGSQTGIIGIDVVMEDLFREGKQPDESTVSEMISRLQHQNYITSSSQKQYGELFLSEYRRFFETKTIAEKEKNAMSNQDTNQNAKKKGLFNLFRGDKKAANEGGCCNMNIIPKEQPAKESGKGGCCNIKIVQKEKAAENKDIK